MDGRSNWDNDHTAADASQGRPKRYYYGARASTDLPNLTGEIRLGLAIIGDAIWCLQRSPYKRNGKRVAARVRHAALARDYIAGTAPLENPEMSFDELCTKAGLDPSAVRKRIYERLESGDTYDLRELDSWLS